MAALTLSNAQVSLSARLFANLLLLGSLNIASGSAPLLIADSVFTGQVAGGSTASSGVAGIMAGSFASSGAETGTSSNQGGMGTTTPYPAGDFGTLQDRVVQLRKADGDKISAVSFLSSLTGNDAVAPVFGFLAYRSDASADQKWRLWLYYVASDGTYTPLTPDTTINGVKVYGVNVVSLSGLGVAGLISLIQVGSDVASVSLGAGAVTTSTIADGNVTRAKLEADAIDGTKLADNAVAAEHIASNAVTNAKMADNSVDTPEIVALAVTEAKIGAAAVTTAKIKMIPEREEFASQNGTSITLAHSVPAAWVKFTEIDCNGQRLHYGAAGDASHFTVSGTTVTFGATVTGNVEVKYVYEP